MKNKSNLRWRVAVATGLVVLGCQVAGAADAVRERISLNSEWRFQKEDPADATGKLAYSKVKDWVIPSGNELTKGAAASKPSGNPGEDVVYTQPGFNDSSWRLLNLPHDWGIEGPFKQEYAGDTGKLPWWGVAWYRKHFNVSTEDQGKQFYLDMDGAMAYATVWLNGKFVGGWPYGYSSFRLDLSPYIKAGAENVLAIRLDNPPSSSRWYPGGGIYRNVWLVKTAPVHVGHWGTFITTPEINEFSATVNVKVQIDNASANEAGVSLRTEIYAADSKGHKTGSVVASADGTAKTIGAGKNEMFATQINVKKPRIWSLQKPNLYVAVTTVEQGGKPVDSYETIFGIRSILFDAQKGFFLNGEHVLLKGVCDHHDLGALGSAISTRGLERQIEILQEMGCNAIRTSHNPPAPELLDLCDRMGMVVMDESFDCWMDGKTPNDYHKLFADWHEKDMRALIRRDRNHPCVILWSIGNEIGEQWKPEGHKISSELASIVHDEDLTRPVTAACNDANAGYNGFQKTVDVFGYNYKPLEYGKFREKNPSLPLFGSETASCISSRGEYFFPVSNDKLKGRADFQVSSYDLCAPPWATTPDTEFTGQEKNPFVVGEFVWTGFDYLGEPTPYGSDVSNLLNFTDPVQKAKLAKELEAMGKIKVPSRSSYFGIIDLCGFKKDRFYIYQAHWRPDFPMAHILPHWNWPDRVGQVTPVHVYTSGDEAELFLNGKSLGRKKKEAFQYRLRWDDVTYQPGELRVIAYKNGKKWAADSVKTTGEAAKLAMTADHKQIVADGRDLSYVTVTIDDQKGLMVPRAKNHIAFELTGPGEIVAVDNGDATDHVSFQCKERNAYNGMCLVIVRSKAEPGTLVLKATSPGLKTAELKIKSKAK